MRKQIRSRRPIKTATRTFPPNKPVEPSPRSCVTSQVHETFLRAIFCPNRASTQCFSQAPGAGRQPISASPVLFLANGVWVTWLWCCRLYKQEYSQAHEYLELLLSSRSHTERSIRLYLLDITGRPRFLVCSSCYNGDTTIKQHNQRSALCSYTKKLMYRG
jgi:hypothetical protein